MLRRHGFAISVTGIATLIGAAMVLFVTHAGPPGAYRRPAPPAPVGAFRDGGVPRRDRAIERALGEDLPALVMMSRAITRAPVDEADRERRIARLRDDPSLHVIAPAWRAMVDSLDRWMVLEHPDAAASHELRTRIDVVSDQLAAAQLGYYLDPEILSDLPQRRTGIFSYRIEDIRFVLADDERERVLELRHLDHIETSATLLGMKPEELGDPVVLLDEIDDKVAAQILPLLAGRPYAMGDRDSAAAGDAIRRELVIALGDDAASPERAQERCQRLVAASVRHHEAQHGFDAERRLRYPDALAAILSEKKSSPFATRARFELSAYTSQIASDMWLPQLSLWNLARHAFRRSQARSVEMFVAVVVIEGLARKLNIGSAGPVMHGGEIDRQRLAALIAPLAARSTAELRSAAAALWTELFGERLPRIVDE